MEQDMLLYRYLPRTMNPSNTSVPPVFIVVLYIDPDFFQYI